MASDPFPAGGNGKSDFRNIAPTNARLVNILQGTPWDQSNTCFIDPQFPEVIMQAVF
jgi:hypothetical protein